MEDAAERLRPYLERGRWLGANNRYLRRAVARVIDDAAAPQNANPKHLAEYLAASAVLHNLDGWSYLGRALGAQCSGNASIARHLAYYAELRAALAFLATQGVGVFVSKNAIIDAAGNVQFFSSGRGGTHRITWLALEFWADRPAGAALLAGAVRPRGRPIDEWVDGLRLGSGAWTPLGRDWLRTWGLDIRMFSRDRDTRNEASYRPTILRQPPTPNSVGDTDFIARFWPLFEPAPGDPFHEIDRHLLRLTLERAFETTTGSSARGNAAFEQALARTLQANAGGGLASSLGRFLIRGESAQTPLLFTAANSRTGHLDATNHANVISRAALLLRVATGATARLFHAAQISLDDYRFWSDPFGESRGLLRDWKRSGRAYRPLGRRRGSPQSARACDATWPRWQRLRALPGDIKRARRSLWVRARCALELGSMSMKYMGSKRVMLTNGFGQSIIDHATASARIVDLFSGSAAVAWFAAEQTCKPVYAYDLQEYSVVLARAILGRKMPANADDLRNTWLRSAKQALRRSRLGRYWTSENGALSPDMVYEARKVCAEEQGRGPVWGAYGGHYFSPSQALALDTLLAHLPENEPERSLCHAGVIVAAGYCAAAPGHTAQPFQPTPTALAYIREVWGRDPIARIETWLSEMSGRHALRIGRSRVGDALVEARRLKPTDLAIVDPPYSAVQYSRFYHVLETVARTRTSEVSGVGRYPPRAERPSSRFSLRTESLSAVTELLDALAASQCRALVTFPTGVSSNGLSGTRLVELARERFRVSTRTVLGRFSTLGGNNSVRASRHPSAELILSLSPC